ncbi:MAG TPA: hypothetical protein VHD91_05100 [Gaiellaceae bacterium]|nr:hypothetical protein [Gaiellaceae bacterium]
MALPVKLGPIRALLKEIETSSREEHALAVGGAKELAAVLRRELARDAAPSAVRATDSPEGAAVLVYVLGREPDREDEKALKRARRARTPIVAVAVGPVSDDVSIPYVLATDVVRVGAGEGFPVERIAETVAGRLGEEGAAVAARVPVLRDAVCARLVDTFSRKNGLLAAAVFVPGADLPLLTLNQVRMILRIAQAHGADPGRERMAEVAATVGAGIGLRAAARELLDLVPFAGWAVKGAVAYTGTRALGEAAIRRFAAEATPQPAGASPGAP